MKKQDLKVLVNPATGSPFFVIGETETLVCGFRLWFEPRVDGSGMSDLCFRFRVELAPNAPEPLVFKDLASTIFPDAKWSKVSAKYVSLYGTFSSYVPLWESALLRQSLLHNEAPQKLFDYLIDNLRAFDFGFDKEGFVSLVVELMDEQLVPWSNVPALDPSLLVLTTSQGTVMFKDGFNVTPVVEIPPLAETLTTLPKAPVVIPKPKGGDVEPESL